MHAFTVRNFVMSVPIAALIMTAGVAQASYGTHNNWNWWNHTPNQPTNTQNGQLSVTGVDASQQLAVGQTGTWSVHVSGWSSYQGGGTLHYTVVWGDENNGVRSAAAYYNSTTVNSSGTFTHVYITPGTYTPVFTVTDDYGHTTQASATTLVTGSSNNGGNPGYCQTGYYYQNGYCYASGNGTGYYGSGNNNGGSNCGYYDRNCGNQSGNNGYYNGNYNTGTNYMNQYYSGNQGNNYYSNSSGSNQNYTQTNCGYYGPCGSNSSAGGYSSGTNYGNQYYGNGSTNTAYQSRFSMDPALANTSYQNPAPYGDLYYNRSY